VNSPSLDAPVFAGWHYGGRVSIGKKDYNAHALPTAAVSVDAILLVPLSLIGVPFPWWYLFPKVEASCKEAKRACSSRTKSLRISPSRTNYRISSNLCNKKMAIIATKTTRASISMVSGDQGSVGTPFPFVPL